MTDELLAKINAAFTRHNAEFDDALALTRLTPKLNGQTSGPGLLLVQLHEGTVRTWMIQDNETVSMSLAEILGNEEEDFPEERITDYLRLHSTFFASVTF